MLRQADAWPLNCFWAVSASIVGASCAVPRVEVTVEERWVSEGDGEHDDDEGAVVADVHDAEALGELPLHRRHCEEEYARGGLGARVDERRANVRRDERG
eukprot:5465458-Prymnesium_polylepis.3